MLGASLLLLAVALALGCGGSPQRAPSASAKAAPRPEGSPAAQAPAEEREQSEAQRAWCVYLEALYVRAAEPAQGGWPKFDECTRVRTMASPKMLRATAECSLAALRKFEGDPFTPEYATEVSRCGSEAMTATSLPRSDLAPFMAALCGRVARCGQVDYDTCRQTLEDGLGPALERALGAMNHRGRGQVRACFSNVSCDEIGPQITACLEPVMEDLLWLPG